MDLKPIVKFKIHPWCYPKFYFSVKIFKTNKILNTYIKDMVEKYPGKYYCKKNLCGEILLSSDRLFVDTISHECVHAAHHLCKLNGITKEKEEWIATATGDLTEAVYKGIGNNYEVLGI